MTDQYVYIAKRPCGKISAACYDDAGYEKDTAKAIAEYIKRGDALTRVLKTKDVMSKDKWMCRECSGKACKE